MLLLPRVAATKEEGRSEKKGAGRKRRLGLSRKLEGRSTRSYNTVHGSIRKV
jgi:hypothetical protein